MTLWFVKHWVVRFQFDLFSTIECGMRTTLLGVYDGQLRSFFFSENSLLSINQKCVYIFFICLYHFIMMVCFEIDVLFRTKMWKFSWKSDDNPFTPYFYNSIFRLLGNLNIEVSAGKIVLNRTSEGTSYKKLFELSLSYVKKRCRCLYCNQKQLIRDKLTFFTLFPANWEFALFSARRELSKD